MPQFTHLSDSEMPRMVDVSHKSDTERVAVAFAKVNLGKELFEKLRGHGKWHSPFGWGWCC